MLQREGLATRTRTGKQVIFRLKDAPPEVSRILEWAIIRQSPGSSPDGNLWRTQRHGRDVAGSAPERGPAPETGLAPDTASRSASAEAESEPEVVSDLEDFLL